MWMGERACVEFCLDGEDMGIYRLITMIDLGHLSRKFDRHDLERTLSFCPEKVSRDIRSDDPEGNEFLPLCNIKGATLCFGFHSHLICSDVINFSPCLDP